MIIPYQELSPDTLHNLVEEFVSRDGTDYGETEIVLENKVEQVLRQIKAGEAFVLYSELHESCTIISKEELRQRQQAGDEESLYGP